MGTHKMNRISTGIILSLGLSFQASASTMFTIDPSDLAETMISAFSANQMNFQTSSLVKFNPDGETAIASGYLNLIGFAGNGNLPSGLTGLGNTWQAWIEFEQTLERQPGSTFGDLDSDYFITSLSYNFYGDSGFSADFTQSTASGSGTEATVTPSGGIGSATLLGSGSLLNIGIPNVNEGTSGSGRATNVTTTIDLTDFGREFFIAPDPFFSITFNSFINDAGINQYMPTEDGNGAVIQGAGTISFLNETIPINEPNILFLMFLGLFPLGFILRHKL